jgi:hypothetical protein
MSINLIICTYGSKYGKIDKNGYLRKTLKVLNSLSHSLSRITIMKPRLSEFHTPYHNYYDMDDINIENIKSIIKIVECENIGISYGQFLTGVFSDLSFDYYIFIEDDYIPFIDNFDEYLKRKCNDNSYLCIFYYKNKTWTMKDYLDKILCRDEFIEGVNDKFIIPDHSCGIISRKTFENIINKYSLDAILRMFNFSTDVSTIWLHQIIFGYLLYNSNIIIDDLTDNLALFYVTGDDVRICYNNTCCNIKNLKINKLFAPPVLTPHEFFNEININDYKEYMENYEYFVEQYKKINSLIN